VGEYLGDIGLFGGVGDVELVEVRIVNVSRLYPSEV
jgi:hypothetical protein